jgi:hypothetical protein
MEYSKHFKKMLKEREILPKWAEQAIAAPDKIENRKDGTCHYIKQISDYENRWLWVVVNANVNPNRAITAFFDRRLRRKKS